MYTFMSGFGIIEILNGIFCVLGNSLESPITQKGTFFFIVDSDLRLMSNLFKFYVFPPIFGDQNRRFAPSV